MDVRNSENDDYSKGMLLTSNLPEQKKTLEPKDTSFFRRKRYLVTFLTALGLGLSYTTMVTLNVSIIEMTVDKKYILNNVTYIKKAEFNFSSAEKITIMSFYNYGMFVSPILGVFIRKVGGSTYFGYCNGVTAILNLLLPAVLRINQPAFLFIRFIQGTIANSILACVPEISIKWIPPKERSQFASYSYAGMCFGIFIAYCLSGITANLFGWEAVFYVTGTLPLIWTIIWFSLVSKSPAKDSFITETERHYLTTKNKRYSSHEKTDFQTDYPWKKIFTSATVCAYGFTRFSESWTTSFINQFIAVFVTDVNGHLNIQSASLLSGGLQLGAAIGLIIGSYIADYLRTKKILTIAAVHNIFMTGSQFLSGVTLLAISFSSNFTPCFIGICITRIFFSLCYVAYGALIIDVAGQYASLMSTIGLWFSGLSNALNPLVINIIVPNHNQSEWQRYFLFLSSLNIAACVIFKLFGSSKLQPWALPTKNRIEETNSRNE